MTIGENIKKTREAAGLTQKALGDKLDVSAVMISRWEKSARNPKMSTLEKIADALNCSVSQLLGWDAGVDPKANEVAQIIYERPELKELLDKASEASDEDVRIALDVLNRLMEKEADK